MNAENTEMSDLLLVNKRNLKKPNMNTDDVIILSLFFFLLNL